MAPFALLLVAIAILPVVAGNGWHCHRNKAHVSALFAVPTVEWLAFIRWRSGLLRCPRSRTNYTRIT